MADLFGSSRFRNAARDHDPNSAKFFPWNVSIFSLVSIYLFEESVIAILHAQLTAIFA
jgi:hypothetical protein